MRGALAIALAAWVPMGAMAACPGETLLSCPVEDGRMLEVCVVPGAFTYSFGPKGAPELQLSVPMAAGTVTPWSGVGSAIWSAVGFPKDGYTYEVWTSVDRNPDDPSPAGGVNVLQGEDMVAELTCRAGTVTTPAFALEDAMAAAGFCWDFDTFTWRAGGCG